MPYSFTDDSFLRSYGFLNLYDQYKDRLLTLAKGCYRVLEQISHLRPNPDEIDLILEMVLTGSSVFAEIVVDLCTKIGLPNPKDPYWPEFFAGSVARCVTFREWPDIAS